MLDLAYSGEELQSHTKYQWKVRVWDQLDSASPWSAPASFSTSIFQYILSLFPLPPFLFSFICENGNWSAQWISTQTGTTETGNYFRKEFSLSPAKKIFQALVSVVGLGLYLLFPPFRFQFLLSFFIFYISLVFCFD
jgi:hypothetical protein